MKYKRTRWLLLLLVNALLGHAQSVSLLLTDNGDGTWTSSENVPQNDAKLVVEYEDATLPVITSAPKAKTGLVYNGQAQELVTIGTAEGGVMNYSLDGENFSADIPTATSAGTYTVYYKVASTTPNCGDTPVQTLTVEIAALTDFADNGDGTWTLAAMPDYNVKLVAEYEDDPSQILDFTDNGDGTWTLAAMSDYDVKLAVEYADLVAVLTEPVAKKVLVYNGNQQKLITAGTADGGVMKYSLDGENFSANIPTAMEPGFYTVYYKVESTTSGIGDTSVETLTARIAPQVDFIDKGGGTWSAVVTPGNYTTLESMPYDEVKLVVEYEDATLPTITTIPVVKTGLVYNGNAQKLVTAGAANGGVMNYSLDGESFSADIPTATSAGTYTVYYKAASTTPNCGDTPVQTLTVEIAQLTDFTDNGDGTWTLAAMPDYDVKLVVEYEDINIILADDADNTTTLSENSGKTANVTLQGRTLRKDGNWNTLCLPFTLTDLTGTPLEGAAVKELETWGELHDGHSTGIEDNTLYLFFKASDRIQAGVPYIVKWESGTDVTDPVFENVEISGTTTSDLYVPNLKMRGIYSPLSLTAGDKTKLYLGADNKLYWATEDMSINAFRAYFGIGDEATAQAISTYHIDYGDGTVATGIKELGSETAEDGVWYTTGGLRLSKKPTRQGVYIVRSTDGCLQGKNGRKVVIK